MSLFPPRHALSRARFFLDKAKKCSAVQRDDFEAYLEASIVFARAALHRLDSEYKKCVDWKTWWEGIANQSSVRFFRDERNWILKQSSTKINQIIYVGGKPDAIAADLYYYETPKTRPTDTVEKHLNEVVKSVLEAQDRF
jgi:hypothetical protein